MKKLFILLLCVQMKFKLTLLFLLLSLNLVGQSPQKTFLDEYYFPTEESTAKYYRIVGPHPAEAGKFLVKDYYLNDTLKEMGTFSDTEIYTRDGYFITYATNGRKIEEGFYKDNTRIGEWKAWYENGQIQQESIYDQSSEVYQRFRVKSFWDSLGNRLTSNGNGAYIIEDSDQMITAKGNLTKGLKDGKWVGYFKNGKIAFEEEYKLNKFIKGKSYDTLGNEYKYDQVFESNNLTKFYKSIGNAMRYPAHARRFGIEGKVVIQIVHNPVGEMVLTRVVKGIGGGCDEEALRVTSEYKGKWTDGKKRGQPIRFTKNQVLYLPITFRLG